MRLLTTVPACVNTPVRGREVLSFICYGKQCGNIRITPEDLAKAMYEEAPLKTSPYGYAWDELDSLGYVSFKIGQVKAAKRIMIKLGIA